MKAFVFNDVEYSELNSLGIAFSNHYNMALDALKEKEFLSFVKSFKKQKETVFKILYESRYLQNALSFIVYLFTEGNYLPVGGVVYTNIKDICQDIRKNRAFSLFLEEFGFRKTIGEKVEDEILKQSLYCLEENYDNELALRFIEGYFHYDSLENETLDFSILANSADKYQTALKLFSNETIKLQLAHSFGLKPILNMEQAYSPVFEGLRLITSRVDEGTIRSIFEGAFYTFILEHLKDYSYKRPAKKIYISLKKLKKEKKGNTLEEVISFNERLFNAYILFTDFYKNKKITTKKRELELNVLYCGVLCPAYMGENLSSSYEYAEVQVEKKLEYSVEKLQKSIRNHKHFARWLIVISLFSFVYYAVTTFLLKSLNIEAVAFLYPMFSIEFGLNDILFLASMGVAFLAGLFILVKKSSAQRKLNKLCLLGYYRNNASMLTDKEILKKDKILEKEANYVKKIDRFYRVYGSVANAFLAMGLTLLVCALAERFGNYLLAEIELGGYALLDTEFTYRYFIYFPALFILVLGLIRHKKTAWSVLLTLLLSLGLSVGIIYFVNML